MEGEKSDQDDEIDIKGCKHANLVDEDGGSTVCEDCGHVVSDLVALQNEWNHTPTTTRTRYLSNCRGISLRCRRPGAAVGRAKKEGLDKIKILADKFNLGSSLNEEAVLLYNKVIAEPKFNLVGREKKKMIAAVCVYVKLKDVKRCVQMKDICQEAAIPMKGFARAYREVCPFLEKTSPVHEGLKIEDMIVGTLKRIKFSEKEGDYLIKLTEEIIEIAKRRNQVAGRAPETIIIGSSYVAWRSIDPRERKCNLKKYCQDYSIPYKASLSTFVTELENGLLEETKCIPWFGGIPVSKQSLGLYLTDILKYSSPACPLVNETSEDDKANDVALMVAMAKVEHPNFDASKYADEELSDISDSEIDQYLRSEQEVCVMKKYQKLI